MALVFAIMHLYNVFNIVLCLSIRPFHIFPSIDKLDGMVDDTSMSHLALCTLLAGVILKGLLFENLCLLFVYHVCFVLCMRSDWFCGLT